jgi:hypothetical protein
MSADPLTDLKQRLERAHRTLSEMANSANVGSRTTERIRGKREGVALALSYLNEIERSQNV